MEKETGIPALIRIAITGPESTGKSVLTQQLAEFFSTSWVPEYAREYIGSLDRPYVQDDILEIAKGQIRNEKLFQQKASGIFFCDTELIVTKIWSEVRFGSCDPWILKQIEMNRYDLYLLCDIDLPWQDDPQREHPHMRKELLNLYINELEERNLPFSLVNGFYGKRLENAISAIRDHGLIT